MVGHHQEGRWYEKTGTIKANFFIAPYSMKKERDLFTIPASKHFSLTMSAVSQQLATSVTDWFEKVKSTTTMSPYKYIVW